MIRTEKFISRKVDGLLLVDKDTGITSNASLQKAKRLFRASKAGHTGSLDPLASGLLPVCLGEATKLSGFLLGSDKRYSVKIRLGVTTTTADSDGEVVETRPVPELDVDNLERMLNQFRGDIQQVPPMYSALKHKGQRLYELARNGVQIELEPRPVTIHELRLLTCEADYLELDVRCSKGTYIRSLAEDIGKQLGCGGHVTRLRRTAVGNLDINSASTISSLESQTEAQQLQQLLPMELMVAHLPEIQLDTGLGQLVRYGQAVKVLTELAEGWVRLYSKPDGFMGLGEILEDGRVAPRRLINS